MATKRKREPLELSPAEAERRSKKAEAERRRQKEIKKAGGPAAYRALSQARKQQKLSQLSAEEAAKVLKQRAYNEQYYAEAKTAGGKARFAERKAARKARKAAREARKARFAERKAAREARKARMAERKARKARAKVRAKAWCGPIDPFDMAAKVQTALQLPGMVLACLQSLASSAGRVQKWAQFVGNHGKTPKAKRKRVAALDMEGHVNKKKTHPPSSASLVGLGPAENWFMNPLQNGVLSTVRECQVCPKP
jgi:histone H1/5